MLKWCSYCQRFLGEIPSYENLEITHGICAACESEALEFTEPQLELVEFLRDIHHQLYEAGQHNDVAAAERVIEIAAKAHIGAVDVLIGIVAPILFQVGEDWKRGTLSIAEEHRFTAYCNEMFARVAGRLKTVVPARMTEAKHPQVLLMNAPGNDHTLAIQILTLWLWERNVPARMLDATPSLEELSALVIEAQPRLLLISMALAEQFSSVTDITQHLAAIPAPARPKVIVGGYAVKLGLVSAIPGAELLGDISQLEASL